MTDKIVGDRSGNVFWLPTKGEFYTEKETEKLQKNGENLGVFTGSRFVVDDNKKDLNEGEYKYKEQPKGGKYLFIIEAEIDE
jgi:hypothetical protein